MNMHQPISGAQRAKRWREAMHAKGLRPKTFWVPDMRLPKVQERIRRDCARLNDWYRQNPEVIEELEALRDAPDEPD